MPEFGEQSERWAVLKRVHGLSGVITDVEDQGAEGGLLRLVYVVQVLFPVGLSQIPNFMLQMVWYGRLGEWLGRQ